MKKIKAALKLPLSFPNQPYILKPLAFLQKGDWYRHALNENYKQKKKIEAKISSENALNRNAVYAGVVWQGCCPGGLGELGLPG